MFTIPEDPNDSSTLEWCRQQGFQVDSEDFGYHICDTSAQGDVRGFSPIHRAIKMNEMDKLEHMLSSTCNLEVPLETQYDDPTPLLLACSEQNAKAVKLVLDRGALVDAKDLARMNGLHRCQTPTRGGTEIARLLLEHKHSKPLNIEAKEQYGRTAVHLAAEMGNVEMLDFLLDPKQGANVNAQTGDKSTPLMLAVLSNIANKTSVIRVLLKYNADPKIQNAIGQTVEDIARNQDEKDILALLKKRAEPGNSQNGRLRRASDSQSALSDASTQSQRVCRCPHCPVHRPGSIGQDDEIWLVPSVGSGWARRLYRGYLPRSRVTFDLGTGEIIESLTTTISGLPRHCAEPPHTSA